MPAPVLSNGPAKSRTPLAECYCCCCCWFWVDAAGRGVVTVHSGHPMRLSLVVKFNFVRRRAISSRNC